MTNILIYTQLLACHGEAVLIPKAPDMARPPHVEEGVSADFLIDMTRPDSGRLKVSMSITGSSTNSFTAMGKNPDYKFSEVHFFDGTGQLIEHEQKGWIYNLIGAPEAGAAFATYTVQPGGLARHGAQGTVAEDFALFDGRVFILPKDSNDLKSARIRFEHPSEWVDATPFRKEGDWWVVDQFGDQLIRDELSSSCMGAGVFEQQTVEYGGTELRVFSHSKWDSAHKAYLFESTSAVFGWFHENLGFDLGAPYLTIWSPKSGKNRIFGGSYVNGTCFENPTQNIRSWQLLSHRIGHSMNKYNPTGMLIRDPRDHWFLEAFASYIEVIATHDVGLVKDQAYWNTLYKRYLLTLDKHPEHNRPLASEPRTSGEAVEFLHYVKGPLVAKMLEVWIARKSGKSLVVFMKEMWAEYGRYQRPFPLREELEAFAGVSLSDFWENHVDVPGYVIPVWKEAFDGKEEEISPAAFVGESALSGDYLHYLASTGEFHTFREVAAFVVQEENFRRALDEQEIRLLGIYNDMLSELDPAARYELARLEEAWVGHGFVPQSAAGGFGSSNPLKIDYDTEDGQAFAQLLKLEESYEGSRPSGGLARTTLHVGDRKSRAVLAASLGKTLVLKSKWLWAPKSARLTVETEGGGVIHDRNIDIRPEWTQTWSHLKTENLPAASGVVDLCVHGEGSLCHSFWLR
jgi:hypothetical protein